MKKILATFIFVLTLSVSLWSPLALLAAEHGGSTVQAQGGTTAQEHGGTAMGTAMMEGSHAHGGDTAATIMEAASILKATHPDLAAKLEKIAAAEAKE
ncbi:MAG: hypothetical protein HY587_04665 [Candidatus Omnitrophica bacterium]|nr:hypothetical protein [Candidatus Omnitrophota bacterium]